MKISKVIETPIKETPHKIDARMIYDKDSAQAVHIKLEAGESLKPHITPVDVFFYVLEGKGKVEIGKEIEEVGPDTLIESPAGIVHCLMNDGDEGIFRVLVVKTPRPTEKTKLL